MGLTWYINRARRMSGREIRAKAMHRLREPWIMHRIRESSMTARLRPDVALPFETASIEQLCHPKIIQVANRVKMGERWVLGLGWLSPAQWNWCGDPATGALWPMIPSYRLDYRRVGTEIRLTWELNRFHDLTILAQAFFVTQDPDYLKELSRLFNAWCRANPTGLGPNWVNGMEAAIRLVNMTWVARMVRKAAPDFLKVLGRQVAIHQDFIAQHLSFGSSANNHLLLELMGLAVSCAYWETSGKEDRTNYYARRFTEELTRQTGPSGLHFEMASHYHLLVTEAAIHVGSSLRALSSEGDSLRQVVGRLRKVVEAITIEEGICRLGDDDDGCVVRFPKEILRWDQVLAGLQQSAWVDIGDIPHTHGPSLENYDGLIVGRSGPYRLIVDGGETGFGPLYAHAHDDGGSIYLGYRGHWIVIDPGTGGYYRDAKFRSALVCAGAHNAPVPETGGGQLAAPFTWKLLPHRYRVVTLNADAVDGVLTVRVERADGSIRRTVRMMDGKVCITDEADGTPFRVAVTVPSGWNCRPREGQYTFRLGDLGFSLRFHGPVSEPCRAPASREFGDEGSFMLQLIGSSVTHWDWEVAEC